MKGRSADSGWPSQAPNPMSSCRLSSSCSGVNCSYHAIDASMSPTRSAMWVHVGVAGRNSYSAASRSAITSLTGHPLTDHGIVAALDPEHERVSPRVDERGVEPVELRPEVVAPQDLGAAGLGLTQDPID